jgi:hypothetical protein
MKLMTMNIIDFICFARKFIGGKIIKCFGSLLIISSKIVYYVF